ncbi:MAG TPA: LuxR C-terminal-related transcriptional regulator, partial [Thermomicrobiales bacterium]|nr:LuxR C-terminal-related transcriptional regulator [Thermomicrobiales bacterium]
AEYFTRMAESIYPRLYQYPIDISLYDQLHADHDNIRSALAWAIERRDAELGQRLAGSLARFWNASSDRHEALSWLERVIELGETTPAIYVRVLDAIGVMAFQVGDYERAVRVYTEAASLYRTLGNHGRLARVLDDLGSIALEQGRYDEAESLFAEALGAASAVESPDPIIAELIGPGNLALARMDLGRAGELLEGALAIRRSAGAEATVCVSYESLGYLAIARGKLADARSSFEGALRIGQDLDSQELSARGHGGLGWLALVERDGQSACQQFAEALRLNHGIGLLVESVNVIEGLASAAAQLGSDREAARLFGAVERLRESAALLASPFRRCLVGPFGDAARRRLSSVEWEAAWQRGRALSLDDTCQAALDIARETITARHEPPADPPARLTSREMDVLRLLAVGRSNREIGAELFLSVRTVERHVANLYRKIDAHNRAEATTFAIRVNLVQTESVVW